MKFSSTCLLLLATPASAFVGQSHRHAGLRPLHVVTDPTETKELVNGAVGSMVVDEPTKEEIIVDKVAMPEPVKPEEPAKEEPKTAVKETPKAATPLKHFLEEKKVVVPLEPGRFADIDYSITLPFLPRPEHLDGSHAGDFGFDPFGLSQEYDLYYMQECEIRHARLAMLAVVGWPVSEMLAPDFMLQSNGCAPSVLNGFNPISAAATVGMFAAVGVLEYLTALRRTYDTPIGQKHRADMAKIWDNGVPGDYNFDPLGLYSMLGDDADGRKALRQLEITQGRYAMLGITTFAALEALSGKPIVEHNMFFEPNIFLPILGAAYVAGTTLYEFSDLTEYPIKIQKSKLGLEFDEWTERRAESY